MNSTIFIAFYRKQCDFESNDLESFRKHYLNFPNVDQNNHFVKKLSKKPNNVFHGKKCLRCNEFLPSSRYKIIYVFLVHYDAGKDVFEEKPLIYTTLGDIRKYEIIFAQHSLDYDFYNAEKLVEEFLLNVKNRVTRYNVDFFIKCHFSLENIQPSPVENDHPIKNFRYWSTEPYQTKSFNDFI